MQKTIIALIVLLVLGAGAWYLMSLNRHEVTATPADYKNISYEIDGQNVTLKDGVSEVPAAPGSASKITTKYFGNEVTADLNGDGTVDRAFLLTQDTGGSGTFYYVVAALTGIDSYVGTNAILLGDRIAPQTTEFRNGMIIVNYADRKSDQPMSASPSVGVSKYLKIDGNNTLVETAP